MANKGKSRDQPANALGALLQGLNDVAQKAEEELGGSPKEEEIAVHAVKVNVFNSMDFLVKNSPVPGFFLRDLLQGNHQNKEIILFTTKSLLW